MTFPKLFGANSTAMSKTSRPFIPALALAGLVLGAGLSPSAAADSVGFNQSAALRLVNDFRAENGVGPVRIDERLMQVASSQSDAMADQDRLGHSVAGSLSRRVRNSGVTYSAIAENVGAGQSSFSGAMDRWTRSPVHRQNILRSNLTSIGFAGAQAGGKIYWTEVFSASPRGFMSAL
jgi:uncharacterized protein YkwD